MPYIVKKGRKSKDTFLGFDQTGKHNWCGDRLDAVRFDNIRDVNECCQKYIANGGFVLEVDEWDGHYEAYREYELQIYRDGLNGIPGGKRWRFRVGLQSSQRAMEYVPGKIGYTSPSLALKAAKHWVEEKQRQFA